MFYQLNLQMSALHIKSLFVNTNNQLSSKFLLNMIRLSKDGPGCVVSPLSAIYPMMMTYLGSAGNTKHELGKGLSIDYSDEDLHLSATSFMECMNTKTEVYTLKLLNGMFVDKRFALDEKFKEAMETIGTIDSVNFREDSEKVRLTVNKWISDNTNQLIPELFTEGSITADDVAIIANTLYFKGKWMIEADDTFKNRNFTTSTGATIKNDQMVFEEMTCRYYEDENMQMVAMPYKHDRYIKDSPKLEMVVVVPKKHRVGGFNLSNFNDNYQRMRPTFVTVQMPKFEHKSKLSLVELFKSFGVNDLFDGDRCDLTKMGHAVSGNVYVSDILQEVVVIVDEEGTEAAAATAVKFSAESCMISERTPIRIVADHTFEYYIVDSVSGAVAFSGVFDG